MKLKVKEILSIIFFVIVLIDSNLCASLIDQQILQQIFIENKIYLIYVTTIDDLLVESFFNEYCSQGFPCTILNKSTERFQDIYAYIGCPDQQFFMIIDASRKIKYKLPVIQGMTSKDLYIFVSKFQQGLLQPFYASQKPQQNMYPPCRKVVGKDFDYFLDQQAQIKVLYLYSSPNHCQICGQVLRKYADLAEKIYDTKTIIFGYYDILKNDHPIIKDQIHPYFLIFRGNDQNFIGVDGQIFKLEQKIIEILTGKNDKKIIQISKKKENVEKIPEKEQQIQQL